MNLSIVNNKKMKWLITIVIILVILSLLKNMILHQAIEIVGSKQLGAKISIRQVSLSIPFQKFTVRDLVIFNPPGFPHEPMLVMPQVTVQVDVLKSLQGKFVFPLILMDLKELIVIKDKDKKLNVDQLEVVKQALKKKDPKDQSTEPMPEIKFDIKVLKLNIGKVILKDFSKDPKGVIQVFDVAIKNKELKNIDSPSKLIISVLVTAMKPTAIRQAGIFAAGVLAGAAFLPAAALGVIVAKDDASAEIKKSFNGVFANTEKLLKRLGEINKIDKAKGKIFAKVYGCDIIVTIERKSLLSSKVTIKARKYMLAKAQIAAGILYQLIEEIK